MIGYYVHHHGSGHRHRALAVARHLGDDHDHFVDATGDEQLTAHALVGTFDPPMVLKRPTTLHIIERGANLFPLYTSDRTDDSLFQGDAQQRRALGGLLRRHRRV